MTYKTKKVLFILGSIWGENGITSHLSTLSLGLMRHGWSVGIASYPATTSEDAYQIAQRAIEKWQGAGIEYFSVSFPPLRPSLKNLKNAFQTLLTLDKIVKEFEPDILHIHSLSVSPYAAWIRSKYKIPFVSTCHLEPRSSDLEVKISSFASRINDSILGDAVIAISREIAKEYETIFRLPTRRIYTIWHGIDNDYFYPGSIEERRIAKQKFKLYSNEMVIAMIGRLDPVKGHETLFRAVNLLQEKNIPVTVLCAGQGYGEEKDNLIQKAKDLNVIDRIHFLGMIDSRQVLWASDVLVLPSFREALPLVIPEAMLCKVLPIRTPASGAFDQIENGIDGFIVPFRDADTLAQCLELLIENPDLLSTMSQKAFQASLRKFTIEKMSENTNSLYEESIRRVEDANPLKTINKAPQ
jgi:glycosyltransferase involved in cell wall biosynthesis